MFGSHCSYVLHNRDVRWVEPPDVHVAQICAVQTRAQGLHCKTRLALGIFSGIACEKTERIFVGKKIPNNSKTSPLHRKPMKSQWFKHFSTNYNSISAALRKNGADAGAIGIEVGLQFFKDFLWHSADLSKSLDPKNIGYSLGFNQQNMGILRDSGDFSVESIKHSSSHGFLPCFCHVFCVLFNHCSGGALVLVTGPVQSTMSELGISLASEWSSRSSHHAKQGHASEWRRVAAKPAKHGGWYVLI